MDLTEYYESSKEQERVAELLALVPMTAKSVLDIGARTGYISRRLADAGFEVTALDLQQPQIDAPLIRCVAGDITKLDLPDNSFDVVLCAEVLEHIDPVELQKACSELIRVSKAHVIVGVPFRQDLRLWQTTCAHCGNTNPPWAHVNSFDDARLEQLFSGSIAQRKTYVGIAEPGTNQAAAWLMRLAGNPYGTYVQEESCGHCQRPLKPPGRMSLIQRVLAKSALACRAAVNMFRKPHANWIHVLFIKGGPTQNKNRPEHEQA